MAKVADKSSRGNQLAGSLFVGLTIAGTAVGMLTNELAVGAMFGVAAGFIVAALVRAFVK